MIRYAYRRNDTIGKILLESGAESAYAGFAPLMAAQTLNQCIISTRVCSGITLGWNYWDGALAIANGIYILRDKNNYHTTQRKILGGLNLFSGVQLFAFTYNPALSSAFAFAQLSFALAMWVDFIGATLACRNAYEQITFSGWQKCLHNQITHIQAQLEKLEGTAISDNGYYDGQPYGEKVKRLEWLEEKGLTHFSKYTPEKIRQKKEAIDQLRRHYDTLLHKYKSTDERQWKVLYEQPLKSVFVEASKLLCAKLVSAVAMTLIAVTCPHIVGTILTLAVAAYYLARNAPRIYNYTARQFSRLFTPKHNQKQADYSMTPALGCSI